MSIEKMIKWMTDREGKVTYSMTSRLGPKSYDCSSAVFFSMIAGGFLPSGSMGNTETLFAMSGTKLKKISRSEVKRGDIFVAGTPGQSNGSGGHTGIFLSNKSFIHCSYYWNGIHTDSHDSYMSTRLTHNFYRIVETESTTTGGKSIEAVAKEVINGLWGNGDKRNAALKAAGYDPTQVQNKVNSLLSGNSSSNIVEQFTTLSVDGKWGPAVTTRLQEYHDTYKDGEVSHQYKEACNANLHSAQFDTTLIGSELIRVIQKGLKAKGYYFGAVDGLCGKNTIKAMQKALGTKQDGVISSASEMVKALQRALNNNKLPW
ncbi:peptidoglycan amidohydrolase family protein [Enterococcus casseliflavus]|uniref:peptidoglycan amidohydrolase family protein n=1 Tax=Enterococcus casseliflavus TaxID=37734 RepID=UPI001AD73CF1|nr:peptidoglycan amidohydrolase family protein [Enterococcus casseliflavus]MBO6385599.1 phage holin [Enterococcus casseliflavus]MDT2984689.1 peptidoglycan amidohydrolase family protein [Enterococcus casseliflavus]